MAWASTGKVRRRKAVTLDGSGAGSVMFDVPSANSKWSITDVLVVTDQAQTTPPYPTATIYLGGGQIGVTEGASWTGNQDIFRGSIDMDAGLDLTVAFTGGLAGSAATVIIEGEGYLWR